MIALALNAAPATSPLDLLAAAEIPAAGPKTTGGSRFHSMLKAATDEDDRPKPKSAKKDGFPGHSAADNAAATAVPVPSQRAAAPPITLNLFPGSDPADKNDGEDSEAASTADEKPAPRRIAEASAQPRMQAEEAGAANRAAPQSATETQPDPDQPLAVAASAADGSLSRIEPAFEVRLQPTEPQGSQATAGTTTGTTTGTAPATADAAGKSGDPRPTKDDTAEAAGAAPEAAPGVSQSAASSSKHGDGSHHPGQEKAQDPASTAPQPGASADLAQARFDVNATVPPAGSTVSSTHAASRPETPAPAEAAPEPPTPPAAATAPAAHDIKLELNGGGQRVEVRLTERDGDIHVAVRTPDARLSDAMRADLPALAAKLEQSGFRTDAWQPGAGSGERRAVETGAGNASQDSQEHGGQNQQQKQDNPQQQQQQKNLTNAPNRKSDRKDFAWLLQTYR